MQEGGRRAILWAFAANLGIALAKFIGWGVTGAASLLAEAIHSIADTGNQGLLLWGGRQAQRAPTPEHPFGYARERYFYAFLVSIVMFVLGSMFAIYEGVEKLLHPSEFARPEVAIAILLVAMALEGSALWNAARAARLEKRGASWWRFVTRSKSPELPVVLLEDLGALLGLLFALVGISLALLTGDPRFDALGSIAIGLLLGAIAVILALETKSLLIGEAVSPDIREIILAAIHENPNVLRVIDLRTQHLGPEQILLGIKVALDPALSLEAIAATIDSIEAVLRERVPAARYIYVEPDLLRELPQIN
ncbi:cation diffusion facilitator family transporter [Myxococcota bacterium]|nr:cation diffusion facilitator family transporter [Myxococcota bacterium]